MRTSVLELRAQQKRKGRRRWIFGLILLAAVVWGANTFLFSRPAAQALAGDPRSSGVVLAVHLRYYLDPTTLIMDLRRADLADPSDLFRALLKATKGVDDVTWVPGRVLLLRGGEQVFEIAGADLGRSAADYASARNPAAVLVALIPKLRLPGGGAPPPMPVTDAADRWASGH